MKRKYYLIYKQFYGFLCHDTKNDGNLIWKQEAEFGHDGISPVVYSDAKSADRWRNDLPPRLCFMGQCDAKPIKVIVDPIFDI